MQVGQAGLSDAVIKEIDRALTAHELIKVKILADRDAREEIAGAMRAHTAAAIVQQVGKVVVLWRPKPDDPLPPA